MTLDETIAAAARLAGVAWQSCGAPAAFSWRDTLGVRADVLAQFVAANPACSAADLYTFAMDVVGDENPRHWREIRAEVRVALEVFRASFLALARAYKPDVIAGEARASVVREMTVSGRADGVGCGTVGGNVVPLTGTTTDIEAEWDGDTGRPKRKGGKA